MKLSETKGSNSVALLKSDRFQPQRYEKIWKLIKKKEKLSVLYVFLRRKAVYR